MILQSEPAIADVGRNEPCPCGSGRRYKSCHGRIVAQSRKVDFVVAGTQKGGTSTLAAYLVEHLDICMPKVKEVHYFDREEYFAAEEADPTVYHSNFDPRPAQRVIGDATPNYMYWEPAPRRIAEYNPAMKFLILLRDPVKRAYSHWNMQVKQRRETLSFEEAIRAEPERIGGATPLQRRRWSYVDRGRYSTQLRRIWQHFPREQTRIFRSEHFQSDPAPVLADIAAFLGVGPFLRVDGREVFTLPYDEPMSGQARQFLQQAYAGEIDELERMLGWDLADWRVSA